MRLSEHFKSPNYERALKRYGQHARESNWPIGLKFDMYNAGQTAFASNQPEVEKRRAFDFIYRTLSGWQVFRNSRHGHWSAAEVHSVLIRSCGACAPTAGLTLVTLPRDPCGLQKLRQCLDAMKEIKPGREYPHMPVAKFTHFFNPRLFPLYDRRFMFDVVCCRAFNSDYLDLCKRTGIIPGETTSEFNVAYTRWASELICGADGNFMDDFAVWFREQLGAAHPDPNGIGANLNEYYAVAFEFVALGAAML
jgi:hypothetical protein